MRRVLSKKISICLIMLCMIGSFSLFFIKATSMTYGRPWDTPQKAITGGAQYIGASYINRGQYTSYFKRFNVSPDRQYSAYSHQYMTNIRAPYSEAYTTYRAYSGNLTQAFHFYIPVYTSMPASTSLPKGSTTSVTASKKSTKKADASFESQISDFPETYKPYLRYLHQLHSNWVFHPVNTNLKWSNVVTAEQRTAYIDGSDKTLRAVDKNGNYTLKEGKTWYLANDTTTAYFLDPRNFLNESRVFMFESLKFENDVSLEAIQKALNGTCLSGSKDGVTFKQMFYNAGKATNINPVYLASLAAQEQGPNGNSAITGNVIYYDGKLYKNIYNYFNIGAYSSSSSPAKAGVAFAAGYTSNTTGKITKATLSTTSYTYTGNALKPTATVYFDTYQLATTNYSISYSNNTNAGTATAKITGKSPFSGTITKTFKINPRSISSLTYSSIADQIYTGTTIKPSVTVKYGSKILKEGTDYTLSYGTNKNVGSGTVKVIGKGNYTGEKTLSFKIIKNSIANCAISGIEKIYTYTGSAIKPLPVVKLNTVTLKNNIDYTLSYSNNVKVGTATITITGKGAYSGSSKKITFAIEKGSISKTTVSAIATQYYTGKAIKPAVNVKLGNTTLKSGTDYTLSYSNNVKVGTATITITGKGIYTGSKKVNFKIEKADLSKATISSIATQYYTGKAIKPAVNVKLGNTTLKSGTDYTLSYSNNVKVGTATITITGKGIYTGSKKINFKIEKANLSKATISSVATQYYTGKQIKPSVTVKWNGKTLKNGTDYTLSYGANKNVGKGTVKIIGKGIYQGSVTKTFTIAKKTTKLTVSSLSNKTYTGQAIKPNVIVKYGNTILRKNIDYTLTYSNNIKVGKATVTAKGKGKYAGITGSTSFIIVPKQPSWNSLKGVSNTLKLSYKKVTGASGYQIAYSTKEKSGYKYVTTKSLTPTITKLAYKTKYYVKVRAYVVVAGKTYYGNESWTLEVRTK